MKKKSQYMNEDGTFKNGFDGCVLHMKHVEGHSDESAQAICGKIAQVAKGGDGKLRLPVIDQAAVASAILASPLSVTIPSGDLPDVMSWQFMPPGRQKITPFVTLADGTKEAREMEINVTPDYADVFQRAQEKLLASAKAGTGDEPFTDYNHEDREASSRPVRYFWGGEDPKTGGVRVETKLTGSGKAALRNGDFARFSPQWVFHMKTGEPLGLPVNQGGLVNRAAFKNIAPILSAGDAGKINWAIGAAHAADGDPDGSSDGADQLSGAAHKLTAKAMTAADDDKFAAHSEAHKAHMKAMAAQKEAGNPDEAAQHKAMAGYHKDRAMDVAKQSLSAEACARAAADNPQPNEPMTEQEIAVVSAKAGEAAVKALLPRIEEMMTPLKTELKALKDDRENAVQASARAVVQEYVNIGAIAPEDTKSIDFWTKAVLASATDARTQMDRLPRRNPTRQIIRQPASGGTATATASQDPEVRIIASAKEARKNNAETFKTDAAAMDAYLRTAEGVEAYKKLREDIITGAAKDRLPNFTLADK